MARLWIFGMFLLVVALGLGCGGGGNTTGSTGSTGTNSPVVSLVARPSTITPGQSVTLSWSALNAGSVQSSTFGATSVDGSLVVTPKFSTDFAITVDQGVSATAHVTVTRLTPRFVIVGASANPEIPEIQSVLSSVGTVSIVSAIPSNSSGYDALVLHESGSFGPSDQSTVTAALGAGKGVVLVGFAPSQLATGTSAFTTNTGTSTDQKLDTTAISAWFGGVTEFDRSAGNNLYFSPTLSLSYFSLPSAAPTPSNIVINPLLGDNPSLPYVPPGLVSSGGDILLADSFQAESFVYAPPSGGRVAWQWHVQGFDAGSTSAITALFRTAALWAASN